MKGKMGNTPAKKPNVYAGAGTPTMDEANSKDDNFKRGGKVKKKAVKVEGKKAKKRLDRATGGRTLSTASKTTGEGNFSARTNAADD